MSGNDEPDSTAPQSQGTGPWPLYILVAIFAAIAGFITVGLIDLVGRMQSEGERPVVAVQQAPESDPKPPGNGLEKLVRAPVPKPLPDISFNDGEGREVTLQGMKGKTLLVNLWATWCAPCKVEMPGLNRLQARLGGAGFEVVAISLDWAGADKPRHFLQTNKLDKLALYFDSKKDLMQKLGAPGLPLSVIIDSEGREIARLAGAAEWDSAEAEALIRTAMSGGQK